jgi:hypothetical protein
MNTDKAQWWLVVLGLVGMVLQPIATDLMNWTDWSHLLEPKSVGRLLAIISTALLSYQAGKAMKPGN